MEKIDKNGLKISSELFEFINKEAIPGTKIETDSFWDNFSSVVHELAPINKMLIEKRKVIQNKIDECHRKNLEKDFNKEDYINFLKSISYLVELKDNFKIETTNVDEEISSIVDLN